MAFLKKSTLRIPDSLDQKITELAKKQEKTKTAVIRQILERRFLTADEKAKQSRGG